MIDHLLFLSETAANFEGMYIFRKNDYCLPLATKHSLEIFSELKEIKQRWSKSINAHRNNGKLLKKIARKSQKLSINRSVVLYNLECGSDLLSMQ